MKLFIGLILFFPLILFAGDTNLIFNIASHHFPINDENKHNIPKDGFNEKNWGIGFEQFLDFYEDVGGSDTVYLFGGYYKNSYRDHSFYGGMGIQFNKYLGGEYGGVTGYKGHFDDASNIVPLAGLIAKVKKVKVLYIPRVRHGGFHIIGLQFVFNVKKYMR